MLFTLMPEDLGAITSAGRVQGQDWRVEAVQQQGSPLHSQMWTGTPRQPRTTQVPSNKPRPLITPQPHRANT